MHQGPPIVLLHSKRKAKERKEYLWSSMLKVRNESFPESERSTSKSFSYVCKTWMLPLIVWAGCTQTLARNSRWKENCTNLWMCTSTRCVPWQNPKVFDSPKHWLLANWLDNTILAHDHELQWCLLPLGPNPFTEMQRKEQQNNRPVLLIIILVALQTSIL